MATDPRDARDRELLYLLAEGTNDVVWTMSVTGEITYVSPSVERMRGITPEEARQQTLDQIHPPESAAISMGYFQDLYAALAEGREPPGDFRGELEYYRADGSTVWTEVHVMPRYGPGGELVEILGVTRDISERRAHEDAMRRAQREAERERTLKEERERIARDLHDDLLQALSAVGMEIATAELRAGSGDADRTREVLGRSREDLQEAIAAARRLVTGLRAHQLEGRGLVGGLTALVEDFPERGDARAVLQATDPGDDVPPQVEEALFRVAQESLANVAKHAGARMVRVRLDRDGDELELVVSDDGRGIDPQAPARDDAYGLTGMRERMQAVGGTLAVQPESGGGTRVTARAPTGR